MATSLFNLTGIVAQSTGQVNPKAHDDSPEGFFRSLLSPRIRGKIEICCTWKGLFELIDREVPARVEPAKIGLVPFLGLDNLDH
jgi:hypothetical protein